MALYVRDLSESEELQLRQWLSSGDRELEHRARVILLSSEGYRVPEIGPMTRSHPANLRKWIRRFNDRGCAGLLTKRSGGPRPRFSSTQREQIVALAQQNPRDLGLNFSRWTLHRLAAEVKRRGIVDDISHESVRQILLGADCYHQSRKHEEEA